MGVEIKGLGFRFVLILSPPRDYALGKLGNRRWS